MHGVAVASKFLAVGSAVPAARADVGALATQSYANLAYRAQGLTLLRTGVAPQDVVAGLIAADPGRAQRQLGVVGTDGPGATYTGEGCHAWAGGLTGDGYAIQGNILTGPEVVEAMRASWVESGSAATAAAGSGASAFADRLLAALVAGDAAGGDRRGRQSAAILVVARDQGYGGRTDVVVDLRVDDHASPCVELERLLRVRTLLFDRPDPATLLPLTGELAERVRAMLGRLGHRQSDLDQALADWAGIENLEERMVPNHLDPLVLDQLRLLSPATPPGPSPAATLYE